MSHIPEPHGKDSVLIIIIFTFSLFAVPAISHHRASLCSHVCVLMALFVFARCKLCSTYNSFRGTLLLVHSHFIGKTRGVLNVFNFVSIEGYEISTFDPQHVAGQTATMPSTQYCSIK